MTKYKVAVIFCDSGLGGTSRSAIVACQIWSSLGYEVQSFGTRGIHPSRLDGLKCYSNVAESIEDISLSSTNIVHFHFSNYSINQSNAIGALISAAQRSAKKPHLIINNIFAIPDDIFNKWPGRKCTTVLGEWAALQYRYSRLFSSQTPIVIGNGQDFSKFRPPTRSERNLARKRFNITDDERVILRIGSPHMGKWSTVYIGLCQEFSESKTRIILVAPPPELKNLPIIRRRCLIIDRIEDDEELLNLYWASDCFALAASRGESFGNVIFESLGTGLPVVYLANEYRDNTPWEFALIPNFSYCRNANAFYEEVNKNLAKERALHLPKEQMEAIEKYSTISVARKFKEIATALNSPSIISSAQSTRTNIPLVHRVKIYARHNPISSWIKLQRLKYVKK